MLVRLNVAGNRLMKSSNTLDQGNRKMIAKLIISQSIVLSLITIVIFFFDIKMSASFLYGGLTFLLPHAYFSFRFFQHSGAQRAQLIVKNFYFGEVVKLIATAVLFIVAFKFKLVTPGVMLLGYGSALVLNWISPLYVKNLS